MKRRGVYVPQRDRAMLEQVQADQILATVERVEHYNYLREKFGPKT